MKTKENIIIIELLAYYYLEFVKRVKESVFALLNNYIIYLAFVG